jgi:hypothetical protein
LRGFAKEGETPSHSPERIEGEGEGDRGTHTEKREEQTQARAEPTPEYPSDRRWREEGGDRQSSDRQRALGEE